MTDARYDDLMQRRAALFAEWKKRVDAAKQFGDPGFYGTGVLLGPDGTLRIRAFDTHSSRGIWELTLEPFSTEIKEFKP